MNAKTEKEKTNKPAASAGKIFLPALTILFLLTGFLLIGWYGLTYIPVRQNSGIPARELEIKEGDHSCTLVIPAGTLSMRHPSRVAVGARYKFDTSVTLDEAMHFVDCKGGIPNWNIQLEAQTTLIGSDVKPHSSIRQPAFDRENFAFQWIFVPQSRIPEYESHLWLRVLVTEQGQTVENWNLLVRDFPMENTALFGQSILIWLIAGGVSILFGILFLILCLQARNRKQDNPKA